VGDKVFGERTRTRLLALLYVYVPVHVNDYLQYEYVLRGNDYFQYDYIRVNDYFPKAVPDLPPRKSEGGDPPASSPGKPSQEAGVPSTGSSMAAGAAE
jgi:hypothetical protein